MFYMEQQSLNKISIRTGTSLQFTFKTTNWTRATRQIVDAAFSAFALMCLIYPLGVALLVLAKMGNGYLTHIFWCHTTGNHSSNPHSKNIKLMQISKRLIDLAHKNAPTAKSSSEVELQAFQKSSKIWFAQTGKRHLRILKNTPVLINFSTKYSI